MISFSCKAEFELRLENSSKALSEALLHTLNLTGLPITDVSALGGVHNLDLSECNNVTDVRALVGVHTLNIYKCKRIKDTSALGEVCVLNLSGCSRVKGCVN